MRLSTNASPTSSPPPPIPRRSKHRNPRVSPSPTDDDNGSDGDGIYSNQQDQSSYTNTTTTNPEYEQSDEIPPNDSSSSYYSSAAGPLTPPTYVNVAPLPTFRGAPGECPAAHLSRFRRVCVANNAASPDAMLRIFPVSLDAEAALWYDLTFDPSTRRPPLPFDEVSASFLAAFRRPEFVDNARSELMSLRQGGDETVHSYHLRMRWILKRWPDHGLPDVLLKGVFVDGLREDFQDWVVPQRPETLEDAVRLAAGWEQARSARAARAARCGFCDGPHEEGECDARRRMKELWLKGESGAADAKKAERGEEGEGVLGRAVSIGRRSQCQCWKHQCSRKIERSNSVVSDKNVANVE